MILILGLRDTVFLGILTLISLLLTITTAVMFHYYHRPVFRFHRFFGFSTLTFAVLHALLVLLRQI